MADRTSEPVNLKRLVIVLDDDSAVRNSLMFLLTIEGFEVRSYASPMELLNDAKLPAFHCLIVDFHLPEMDGLGVVEKLRENNNCPRAILVTSHPDATIRERAAALGVPVVLKPFRGTELADCIRGS
jgi:FixJ family two-component response regulator